MNIAYIPMFCVTKYWLYDGFLVDLFVYRYTDVVQLD